MSVSESSSLCVAAADAYGDLTMVDRHLDHLESHGLGAKQLLRLAPRAWRNLANIHTIADMLAFREAVQRGTGQTLPWDEDGPEVVAAYFNEVSTATSAVTTRDRPKTLPRTVHENRNSRARGSEARKRTRPCTPAEDERRERKKDREERSALKRNQKMERKLKTLQRLVDKLLSRNPSTDSDDKEIDRTAALVTDKYIDGLEPGTIHGAAIFKAQYDRLAACNGFDMPPEPKRKGKSKVRSSPKGRPPAKQAAYEQRDAKRQKRMNIAMEERTAEKAAELFAELPDPEESLVKESIAVSIPESAAKLVETKI
jgi:hypothetical protein